MNITRQKNDPPTYPYGRAQGLVSVGGNLYRNYSISIPLMPNIKRSSVRRVALGRNSPSVDGTTNGLINHTMRVQALSILGFYVVKAQKGGGVDSPV